jgi:hypothetical protein
MDTSGNKWKQVETNGSQWNQIDVSGVRFTTPVETQMKVSGPRWILLERDGSIPKELFNMHNNLIFYTEKI